MSTRSCTPTYRAARRTVVWRNCSSVVASWWRSGQACSRPGKAWREWGGGGGGVGGGEGGRVGGGWGGGVGAGGRRGGGWGGGGGRCRGWGGRVSSGARGWVS